MSIINNNLIPTDPEFPGQFLESLEKSNAGHSDQAPLAVILLSSVNNAAQMNSSNFHFIEQVARTHRIYLRLIEHPNQLPKLVQQASDLAKKPIDRLILNGHTRVQRRLRLGTHLLDEENLDLLFSCQPYLHPGACITIKGCFSAKAIEQAWREELCKFLGEDRRIEGSIDKCSSRRTFFVNDRVYTFNLQRNPLIKMFKVSKIKNELLEIPTYQQTPPFEPLMREKMAYVEKYKNSIEYYEDLSLFYSEFSDFLRQKDKDDEALELKNRAQRLGVICSLKRSLNQWEELPFEEKLNWIKTAVENDCEMLIGDFLAKYRKDDDSSPLNDNFFFAAEFFIECCRLSKTSLLQTLVNHPIFHERKPYFVTIPFSKGKLKNWFAAACETALKKPEILSILSKTRWAAQLSHSQIKPWLEQASSIEERRALLNFPNAKGAPLRSKSFVNGISGCLKIGIGVAACAAIYFGLENALASPSMDLLNLLR